MRTRCSEGDMLSCPSCGYNLAGLHEARCPECGAKFTLEQLFAAQQDHRERFTDAETIGPLPR